MFKFAMPGMWHSHADGIARRPTALTRLAALLLIATVARAGAAAYPFQVPRALGEPGEGAPPNASDPAGATRTDAFGDPLPEGAARRLGTLRFRQGGGYVERLLVSPDGKTLVSRCLSRDETIAVWDLATGKRLRRFGGRSVHLPGVALSPDGRTLAVGTDKTIAFHDLESGREVRRLTSPLGETEGLAFAPDGKTLASGHGHETVLLWDLARCEVRARLAAKHFNPELVLAFSPDGKLFVAHCASDKLIRVFDAASGQERYQLSNNTPGDVAFSPDGALLAVVGLEGVISLWDPATGKLARELRGPHKHTYAVAWSPDGKTLATSEYHDKGEVGYVRLWDVAAGNGRLAVGDTRGLVHRLAYTPDGKTLVSGDNCGVIRLWDAATGEERHAAGNAGPVSWLALSGDGKTLAYGNWRARFWDMSAGREAGRLPDPAHYSFALSPDGRTLAGGGSNFISVWEVSGRRLLRRLQGDADKGGPGSILYNHVAFAPDGKTLAACGPGVPSQEPVVHLWDYAAGALVRRLSFKDRPDELLLVDGVAFSPDGKVLAASGRTAQEGATKVRFWEVATGKALSPQTAAMNGVDRGETPHWTAYDTPLVVFSPDGRLLATRHPRKGIPVWEALTGRERFRLDGHEGSTWCVAFAPDGRTLASAGRDGTVRLWDVEKARELKRLTGHRGWVHALAFTPDGATLISGGADTTVLFWDVAAVTGRGRERTHLTAGQWEPLWADLAAADAAVAHRAMARLAAAPEVTLPALKQRLRLAPAADADRLARLLRDLDAEEFAAREQATRELRWLGEEARPMLERERDRPGTAPEARRRLDGLLAVSAVPAGERLQELRAVEVLERIGDAEARRLLEALARGEPEARAAAWRLARRAEKSLDRPEP